MIHNFIRLNQGYLNKYDEWNDDDRNENGDEENDENDDNGHDQINATMRDNIANDMWTQYQNYLATSGQGRRVYDKIILYVYIIIFYKIFKNSIYVFKYCMTTRRAIFFRSQEKLETLFSRFLRNIFFEK